MKFDIKQVIRTLHFDEYEKVYEDDKDAVVHIWANPTRAVMKQRDELDQEYFQITSRAKAAEERSLAELKDAKGKAVEKITAGMQLALDEFEKEVAAYVSRSYVWYVQVWSQGLPDTHWPLEDIEELAEQDPALLFWLSDRTREIMNEQREHQKKD